MAGQEYHEDNGLGSPAPTGAEAEDLKWRFYDLDFSVRKSRRYHEKFCAFYGWWRDAVKVVTVIAGSGLFLLLIGDWKHTAEWLAAFVALWAMLDYLATPDKKAEKHCELNKRFIELGIRVQNAP